MPVKAGGTHPARMLYCHIFAKSLNCQVLKKIKTNSADGLTFQRGNSFYKKLIHSIEFDFKYWEGKCSGKNDYLLGLTDFDLENSSNSTNKLTKS